ncbi:hypothetical protein P7C00_19640 [Pseudomonas sp. JDS08PS003]|uniref:hypothetical protein n=1 Tax=Pseudomonas sp. JDS08PS003 TaxID=2497162 RepID=UPI0038575122
MGKDDADKTESDLKMEAYIRNAIEQIAVDAIKDAAIRAFPVRKERYRDQLVKYIFGPVFVGAALVGAFSFFTSCTASKIQEDQQRRELQRAENIGVYLKYKQAHRSRLLQGSLLVSSLKWGFTTEIVSERKRNYDLAYLKTNEIFPDARDYLGRVVVPAGVDSKDTYDLTIEKLRNVTTVYDLALTAGYAVRNDWDQGIWTDRIRKTPDVALYKLKRERDCKVNNTLMQYPYHKKLYNATALKNIYTSCTDAVFQQLDDAIRKETSNSVVRFSIWKKSTSEKIAKACALEDAELKKDVTEDCSKSGEDIAASSPNAFQVKRL